MKTKDLIQGTCPDCGDEITPAKTQKQFNRNMGMHKWKVHNHISQKTVMQRFYRENAKRRKEGKPELEKTQENINSLGPLPNVGRNGSNGSNNGNGYGEQPAKRKYTRHQKPLFTSQFSAPIATPTAAPFPAQPLEATSVEPAFLDRCPCCKTRFYMAKGQ